MRDIANRYRSQIRDRFGIDLQNLTAIDLDRLDAICTDFFVFGVIVSELEHFLKVKIRHRNLSPRQSPV